MKNLNKPFGLPNIYSHRSTDMNSVVTTYQKPIVDTQKLQRKNTSKQSNHSAINKKKNRIENYYKNSQKTIKWY